jgi:hypothetical protein
MGFAAAVEPIVAYAWGGIKADAVVTDAPPEVVMRLLRGTRFELRYSGTWAYM